MVSHDLFLLRLKIEISTRETNSMPFLVFLRDHLRSTPGIICGSRSFAVQFWDHFPSGDHLRSGIICGAVHIALGLLCFVCLFKVGINNGGLAIKALLGTQATYIIKIYRSCVVLLLLFFFVIRV